MSTTVSLLAQALHDAEGVSALYAADVIRDAYRAKARAILTHLPDGLVVTTVAGLAEALKAKRHVAGVSGRYGTFNEAHWERTASDLAVAIGEAAR
jgi:hypothetical protein